MEIKVKDFVAIIAPSSRVRIVKKDKTIALYWACDLPDAYKEEIMKKFSAAPEIRHKKWKQRGLTAPMQPEETPDYGFSDLEMKLYYTIYI